MSKINPEVQFKNGDKVTLVHPIGTVRATEAIANQQNLWIPVAGFSQNTNLWHMLPEEIKLVDCEHVHVIADWLEQEGCPMEWVARLRKEFPIQEL